MGKATVDKARKAAVATTSTVDIPEWGGTVTIRRAMLADSSWAARELGPVDKDHPVDMTEFQLLILGRLIVEPDLGADAVDILRTQPVAVIKKLIDVMNEVSEVAQADQFRPEDDA